MDSSFAIGGIVFIPLAYHYPDWRTQIRWFIGVPLILFAALDKFIYESPKFLIVERKFDEAKTELRKIARVNGISLGDFKLLEEVEFSSNLYATTSRKHGIIAIHDHPSNDLNYDELFKWESMKKATMYCSGIFFSTYFIYYGCVMAVNDIASGSVYIFAFLLDGAELSSYGLAGSDHTNTHHNSLL